MAEENKHSESEFQFIQEKIKKTAPRRNRILRKTTLSILFGAVFGVVACITFVLIYPWAQERFGEEPVKEISIPKDEEPMETEDEPGEVQQESIPQPEIDMEQVPEEDQQAEDAPQKETIIMNHTIRLDLDDYSSLFEKMSAVGREAARSMVTVTAESSGTDWFNAPQENRNQVSGMLVGDNGVEQLILTNYSDVQDAEQISVAFSDNSSAYAVLKKYDRITNLAVLGVNLADMSEMTRNQVKNVVWGNSRIVKPGEPVIAVGNPVGLPGSMLFGNITAVTYDVPVVDGEYQLMLTDMMAGAYSDGALVNFMGETVGWIQDSYLHPGNEEAMTVYGISSLKSVIEHLCNNQDIVYLGVIGMDLDAQMQELFDLKNGVYISGVEMDSPAMAAGMQSGDIIVDISGQKVEKMSELQELLLNFSAEQVINIKVLRQGKEDRKELEFTVSLTALK